ncbi:MAG: TldD/PmbA family protein [Bdellovibrio sp.]|jgi:TldD protein
MSLLAKSLIEKTLNEALSTGADFAELFAEESYSSVLSVMDSKPFSAQVGRQYGAGIRVHFGTEEIYMTTNDLSERGLLKAAQTAAAAKPTGTRKAAPVVLGDAAPTSFDGFHSYGQMPWEIDRDNKFKFLMNLDQTSRKTSALVTQTQPRLIEKVQKVLIANSEGLLVEDLRRNFRTFMEVYVEDQGKKETYHKNDWSTTNPLFYEALSGTDMAVQTTQAALTLLKADFAPAGEFPVVIDQGFGGVIFHEACGHGLETTSVAQEASVFCGKLNQKIADSCVTAIDDGTIEGGWGSQAYDDEGRRPEKTTLIENGILKSYMVDRLGAQKTGYSVTGSGRRQNYKYAPTSRMRNTYIAAGTSTLEEMIRDVDLGIYAKDMGGGSVSPGTGDFNFAIQESYMIRNGKLAEPVKGASLIGRGIETLGRISKVGNNLKLSAGMCGSVSGSIPAAVGQPAVLVSKILVGGRAS